MERYLLSVDKIDTHQKHLFGAKPFTKFVYDVE